MDRILSGGDYRLHEVILGLIRYKNSMKFNILLISHLSLKLLFQPADTTINDNYDCDDIHIYPGLYGCIWMS